MNILYRGIGCELLIVLVLFGVVCCDYGFPDIEVKFYEGGSFQVSIPADERISLLSFHGQKTSGIERAEEDIRDKIILEPTGEKLVVYDENANFAVGETLQYKLEVICMGQHFETIRRKEVKGKTTN